MSDDGVHGDSLAGDAIFGCFYDSFPAEDFYSVVIGTNDLDSLYIHVIPDEGALFFTTIGPVNFSSYEIVTSGDSTLNPDETHRIKFRIINQSQSVMLYNVKAQLTSLDTFVTIIRPSISLYFGEVSPGQAVLSSNYKSIKFSPYYSGPLDTVRFILEISAENNVFWRDSTAILIVGVQNTNPLIPKVYSLLQNYPNPFNPSTTIEFTLPKSEFVELKVFNILGKEVSTVVSKKVNQGNHTYTFGGKNLASGIYYYQLVAGEYREVKKMILIK